MPFLIFDCDGVLADTERNGHLPAFNRTFEEFGVPVQWSDADYAVKVLIGGGKERMASLLTPEFVAANGLPADEEGQRELLAQWHRRKTAIYTDLVESGALPARPGIARIAGEADAAGWGLAVASTSAEASVRAVLEVQKRCVEVGLRLGGIGIACVDAAGQDAGRESAHRGAGEDTHVAAEICGSGAGNPGCGQHRVAVCGAENDRRWAHLDGQRLLRGAPVSRCVTDLGLDGVGAGAH